MSVCCLKFNLIYHKGLFCTVRTNWSSPNLFDPLYISHISIQIARGRSSITQEFFLFASRCFSNDDYKGDDTLTTLEHFHKKGIIIFPKKKRVDEWLRSELKINDIPEFPRSVLYNTENQFGNGIDSDIGLMTDG